MVQRFALFFFELLKHIHISGYARRQARMTHARKRTREFTLAKRGGMR